MTSSHARLHNPTVAADVLNGSDRSDCMSDTVLQPCNNACIKRQQALCSDTEQIMSDPGQHDIQPTTGKTEHEVNTNNSVEHCDGEDITSDEIKSSAQLDDQLALASTCLSEISQQDVVCSDNIALSSSSSSRHSSEQTITNARSSPEACAGWGGSDQPEPRAVQRSADAHLCCSFFSPCRCRKNRSCLVRLFSDATTRGSGSWPTTSTPGELSLRRITSHRSSASTAVSSRATSVVPSDDSVARKRSSNVIFYHPEFLPAAALHKRKISGSNRAASRHVSFEGAIMDQHSSCAAIRQASSCVHVCSEDGGCPTDITPEVPTLQRHQHLLLAENERLKHIITERDKIIDQLQNEMNQHRRRMKKKEQEIAKLHREIHKIQSVLDQSSAAKLDCTHSLSLLSVSPQPKKQGVSAESYKTEVNEIQTSFPKFDKDFRSKQLIKEAIMDNDFLKNLDSSQVKDIVNYMHSKSFSENEYIIREGEAGNHLFVAASGAMEVLKKGRTLGQMTTGKAFGELAILYNCTRTASVRAVTPVQVWMLERRCFQSVMMRTAIQRMEANLSFLQSVPLLASIGHDKLTRIADVVEMENYTAGTYIIRQGNLGNTFYIISKGRVKVTQRMPDGTVEEIRVMAEGEYFGEQALMREERRTASIIALSPGVSLLALDRQSFAQLIGDLQELKDLTYDDTVYSSNAASSDNLIQLMTEVQPEYPDLKLQHLEALSTIGVGGFGRVQLVRNKLEPSQTFALKCLRKHYIVDTQQQEHVHSEKTIMMYCRHQFIVRMYCTFRDSKYVYMLMEVCLGGEVWSILRDRGHFDTEICRFCAACVIEALDYLHSQRIIYRDLKPENLLLDNDGYCKITDFGFSKHLSDHSKTWTFCGTPEYVSPEIILNKGHDFAVDFWSLGILIYELYTGAPPFTSSDPMRTYNIILKGFDQIVFPSHVPRSAETLMKKLCRYHPTDRLGCQKGGIEEVRRQKWFQSFDWDGLRQRALTPPIIPQVCGVDDCSNFDSYDTDVETPPDELSGWDQDF